MNIKRLRLINEILIEQMNHWMLFPIAMLFSGVTMQLDRSYGVMLLFMWELCSLTPFIFYKLRTRAKSVSGFLFRHPLTAAVPTAAAIAVTGLAGYPSLMGAFVCVGSALMYTVYSLYLNLKKAECFTGPVPLPVAVGLTAVAAAFVNASAASAALARDWMGYFYFPLMISIGLFFIVMYIQNYIDFLNANKSSAGYLPAAEMFHSGLGLSLSYTVFGVVVMGLLAFSPWLKTIGLSLAELVTVFLKWLASLLSGGQEQTPEDEEFVPEVPLSPERPVNGPFWLWEVLQYVALAAVIVLLAVIFIRLLIRLIRYLQGLALARVRQQEDGFGDVFDVREKCGLSDRSSGSRHRGPDSFSYSDRIRRIFKARVTAFGKEKRPELYTAREWERKLSVSGMAAVYEQARYSKREMTARDLKRMREAVKGIRGFQAAVLEGEDHD